MPLISIIVPVFNVEPYLIKCIDSILDQTYKDFELILVDDGSPDKSGEICDVYSRKDNRIKVIHKHNGGLADARNAGLAIANGEFVGFVDSDDYVEANMYEELLNACLINNAEIAVCGRYDVTQYGITKAFSFSGEKIWSSKEAIANSLILNDIDSSACDKLFKRSLFDSIRFPLGKYNEDIFIMVKILDQANKIVHIGKSKYYYCHRANSITTENFSTKKLDAIEACNHVIEFVKNKYPDLGERADSQYYFVIINLLKLLHNNENINDFKESYRYLMLLVRNDLLGIVFSKYLDKWRKIIAVLMVIKVYSYFQRVNRLIKRAKNRGCCW